MFTKATPPPAYFLSLSLENVRSFGEKQTIHFTEGGKPDGKPAQWTIILGDNGVGKTTVLKALAATVTEERPIDKQDPYGIPAMWRLANSVWSPFRSGIPDSANLETRVIQDINMKNGSIGQNADYIEAYVSKINGGGMMAQGHNPRGLICYGYGAGRTIGNSIISKAPEDDDYCASLFDERADLLNPEEWFLQMEYSSLKHDKRAAIALNQVQQALLQVLPDIVDIRISSKGHQQYLELETPYGWVRLRDMSLGYQTLVVWLTDFASKLFIRYPNSKNPLEEPAIVLIDEIDLHLHPSWQRKLIGFLSGIFKNTQFIATAHSPLVVQAAGDQPGGANVVLLRREGDQTVVYQNPEDVRGWRLDQIMTSELFGLETARSLATEEKLAERAALLSKARRTAAEKKRLQELTAELDQQPLGETPSERDVNAVLQQLREKLGHNPSDAPAA